MVKGQMHVLGSKIIGKDIHLAVLKGILLEANIDTSITFVYESGLALSFYNKNKHEVGITFSLSANIQDFKKQQQYINESSLVEVDTLTMSIFNIMQE